MPFGVKFVDDSWGKSGGQLELLEATLKWLFTFIKLPWFQLGIEMLFFVWPFIQVSLVKWIPPASSQDGGVGRYT